MRFLEGAANKEDVGQSASTAPLPPSRLLFQPSSSPLAPSSRTPLPRLLFQLLFASLSFHAYPDAPLTVLGRIGRLLAVGRSLHVAGAVALALKTVAVRLRPGSGGHGRRRAQAHPVELEAGQDVPVRSRWLGSRSSLRLRGNAIHRGPKSRRRRQGGPSYRSHAPEPKYVEHFRSLLFGAMVAFPEPTELNPSFFDRRRSGLTGPQEGAYSAPRAAGRRARGDAVGRSDSLGPVAAVVQLALVVALVAKAHPPVRLGHFVLDDLGPTCRSGSARTRATRRPRGRERAAAESTSLGTARVGAPARSTRNARRQVCAPRALHVDAARGRARATGAPERPRRRRAPPDAGDPFTLVRANVRVRPGRGPQANPRSASHGRSRGKNGRIRITDDDGQLSPRSTRG